MDNYYWQKAGRSDYSESSFYYLDKFIPDCPRLVAWTQDFEQFYGTVFELLDLFPDHIEILLKRRINAPEEDDYERWKGNVRRENLGQAIAEYKDYVFGCGYETLCVMNPETGEYFVIDDFGLLWIYTHLEERKTFLQQHGFENRVAPLVTEGGCYVRGKELQDQWREEFVKSLGLEHLPNRIAP